MEDIAKVINDEIIAINSEIDSNPKRYIYVDDINNNALSNVSTYNIRKIVINRLNILLAKYGVRFDNQYKPLGPKYEHTNSSFKLELTVDENRNYNKFVSKKTVLYIDVSPLLKYLGDL